MAGFLSKLFGGKSSDGGSTGSAAERECYKGFEIEARPKAANGAFNIAGAIRREDDPEGPVHEFIRADTFTDAGDAARFTIIKAKQIIDQRGEKLFDGGGW